MCDRSKLSYYFTKKNEISLQELFNTCVNITVNTAIENTNETVALQSRSKVSHHFFVFSCLFQLHNIYLIRSYI